MELPALGHTLADELNRFVPEGVWLTCERWGPVNHLFIFTNTSAGRWGGIGVTDVVFPGPTPTLESSGSWSRFSTECRTTSLKRRASRGPVMRRQRTHCRRRGHECMAE